MSAVEGLKRKRCSESEGKLILNDEMKADFLCAGEEKPLPSVLSQATLMFRYSLLKLKLES